jgi:hypothetical protein
MWPVSEIDAWPQNGHDLASGSERGHRRDRVLEHVGWKRCEPLGLENVTTQQDIAQVAAQLAELTQTVEAMAKDLKAMTERADTQEVRVDTQEARADNWQTIAGGQDVLALKQQERIDLAARELAAVSHRLQAAATLLQETGVYSDPRKRLRLE